MMLLMPAKASLCVRLKTVPMMSCADMTGRAEIPRLRGERDEAQKQVARLQASRDDLARQQGHWKGRNAKVLLVQGPARYASPAAVHTAMLPHARLKTRTCKPSHTPAVLSALCANPADCVRLALYPHHVVVNP